MFIHHHRHHLNWFCVCSALIFIGMVGLQQFWKYQKKCSNWYFWVFFLVFELVFCFWEIPEQVSVAGLPHCQQASSLACLAQRICSTAACFTWHPINIHWKCSNLIKIGKIIFARDTCTCKIQTNSRDIENDLPQGWQGSLGSGEVQTGKNYCVFFGEKNHKQSSQPSSDRDRRVVISLVKVLL